MLYIGFHKGAKDDGYICSSKSMLEEYKNRPEDFSRQIIASGTTELMKKFETILLKTVNAKNDKKFYNKHNGDGDFICKAHTRETRELLSKINKESGRRPPDSRFFWTDEYKESHKKKMIGNTYRLGKKDSEETRKKKVESFKNSKTHAIHNKNKSQETRKKISNGNKGKRLGSSNPMAIEEYRKKVGESKIGKRAMVSGKIVRMVIPGSIKFYYLSSIGYRMVK